MAIENVFNDASSVMTVISFTTFLGILLWTYVIKRNSDFDAAAHLPFADDFADHPADSVAQEMEKHHG